MGFKVGGYQKSSSITGVIVRRVEMIMSEDIIFRGCGDERWAEMSFLKGDDDWVELRD